MCAGASETASMILYAVSQSRDLKPLSLGTHYLYLLALYSIVALVPDNCCDKCRAFEWGVLLMWLCRCSFPLQVSAAREAIGDADFFLVARTDARGINAKYGLEVRVLHRLQSSTQNISNVPL